MESHSAIVTKYLRIKRVEMSSSKEENLASPVESIENENQTLLPQTDILDGSTDGKTGNSSTSQTNNGTYDEKSKANATSNSG